jgi:hypothetical protein
MNEFESIDQLPNAEFIERMRVYEVDHEPDGWPAVKMKHITRLCDLAALSAVDGDAVGEVVIEAMGIGDAQMVRFHMYKEIPPVGTKLYTAPPSVEVLQKEVERLNTDFTHYRAAACATEATLREQLTAAEQLAADRLEQMQADRRQYLDLRQQLAQPAGNVWDRIPYSELMGMASESGLGPADVSGLLQVRLEKFGRKVEARALLSAPVVKAGEVPEVDEFETARLILSDCGISSDNERLLERVQDRLSDCLRIAKDGRIRHSISMPEGLHFDTAKLVKRFARALANKLHAAEKKYGYSDGWMRPDWMDECRAHLMEHVAKGDPRDVAAYCAFLWHHDEPTAAPVPGTVGQEWQPIETAPKALLPESGCAVSDYVLIAYDLFDGDEVYGKGISVGRLRRGGRGDATTEYWDSPSFDEIYEPPTHWMPLLAPPQAAPEQEGKL